MTKLSPTWPLQFKGRNNSGPCNQNFVWKCGNVYVMDNHRAALWCWLQELDLNDCHSIFHIDQHADTLQCELNKTIRHLPPWDSTLQDYLNHSYKVGHEECKVIRWDNYMSIYLNEFGSNIKTCRFATHRDGDKPNHKHVLDCEVWEMPGNMEYWLSDKKNAPWIVNIDLDYFYWDSEDNDIDIMVSDEFLRKTFTPLRHAIEKGTVAVTTICLTPDPPLTPGWEATEALATKLLGILGMEFKLPD